MIFMPHEGSEIELPKGATIRKLRLYQDCWSARIAFRSERLARNFAEKMEEAEMGEVHVYKDRHLTIVFIDTGV